MPSLSEVELPAGPVADRLSIWPMDDGSYGLDATFQGASGHERMQRHEAALQHASVRWSLRQEMDGGWTIRFGPISAADVSAALRAFVS